MSELMSVDNDGHHVVMEGEQQYVTMTIAGQLFGVPIMQVEDIVEPDRITKVPLASKQIAGVMNLRGRVVTVIDLKQCLGSKNGNGVPRLIKGDGSDDGKEEKPAVEQKFSITVEKNHSLYTLLVDNIGDVRALPDSGLENVPPNLDASFRKVASGVYRLQGELLVVLDVDKVFELLIEAS
jgi:purine-binding chemotaxis protein CheW